jgi:hypothetical protein
MKNGQREWFNPLFSSLKGSGYEGQYVEHHLLRVVGLQKVGVWKFARNTDVAKSGGLHLGALTKSVSSYYRII